MLRGWLTRFSGILGIFLVRFSCGITEYLVVLVWFW